VTARPPPHILVFAPHRLSRDDPLPEVPLIRPATADDLDAIALVESRAAYHPWTADQLRSSLENPKAWILVAALEGQIAGHLVGQSLPWEGELHTVAVDPSAQRKGVGRALVAAAMGRWTEEGVDAVFLEVRHDNAPALALYRALGWTPVGRRPDYYGPGAHALVFKWVPAP